VYTETGDASEESIMDAWTQKPTSGTTRSVARPATGETPIQHVRIPSEDWKEINNLTGRKGAALVRQFVRWYLRRPGAKLPARPSPERTVGAVSERETEVQ
jgi:hypothetical protein